MFCNDTISLFIFVQIFLKQRLDTIQWISINKEVRICRLQYVEGWLYWVQMTELLTFVSVSAGIQTRRHTKVCQLECYANHICHPLPLPLQWIAYRPLWTTCVYENPHQKGFFHSHSPQKNKVWILSCVLLILCIITFWGDSQTTPSYTSDEYNRKPVRSPRNAKSFWLWIQRTSTH